MTKRIFVAATMQNDGKTTVSLGLISALKKRFKKIGFIKPIGQRYLLEQGYKVDEDSILIEEVCGIKCNIKDMSPVAVERGFTEKYIQKPRPDLIAKQIERSFARVAENNHLVIIEGTGHAGVGSVFDFSNAVVAKMLKAKVILVASGGIGRPIDEILLNKALFDKEGVALSGAIINKVLPEKFTKVNSIVRSGLSRKGVRVVGVMPYQKMLDHPTVEQILEETDAKLICGADKLNTLISKVIVGAMNPNDTLKYFEDRCLLITGGDRADLILAVAAIQISRPQEKFSVAGIILSGGITPPREVVRFVEKSGIPLLVMNGDTYSVASQIHDLTVKIRPRDTMKIELVKAMVEEYVEIDEIVKDL